MYSEGFKQFTDEYFDAYIKSGKYSLQVYDDITGEPVSDEVAVEIDRGEDVKRKYLYSDDRFYKREWSFRTKGIKLKYNAKKHQRVVAVLKRNGVKVEGYPQSDVADRPWKIQMPEITLWAKI